jgi:hypothetical protein
VRATRARIFFGSRAPLFVNKHFPLYSEPNAEYGTHSLSRTMRF